MKSKIYNIRQIVYVAIMFFVIALFSISETVAQVPAWTWAHRAGGLNDDEANCVTTDALGNVYVAGYFDTPSITFGSTTLTNGGATDGFIVKYDVSGNVLWAHSIASAGADKALSVAADVSGNCYVAGQFNSSTITIGAITLTGAGNEDMFIVKYDATGNVIWAQSAGGAYGDVAYSVTAAADGSGDIYMTGTFPSASITFGSITLTNFHTSSGDMFIVKYDADGNALWAKNAGGFGNEAANSVTTDASGNSYITGQFDNSFTIMTDTGTTTLMNVGGFDVFLVKYDIDGNVLWAQSGGSSGGDYSYSVAADPTGSGDSYITGSFTSPSITFGATTLTLASGYDMYIVKYDANGNVLWAKNAGAIYDVAQSVTIDPSGNVYVTGYFGTPTITFGSTTLTNHTFDTTVDIYIVKYDGAGNVLWATNPGGTSQDFVTSITADPAGGGGICLAGYFYSSDLAFDSISMTSAGYFDMFIAKLGDTTLLPPVSAFSSPNASGCAPFCTGFSDQSLNSPISWNWIFEGASPSSSSEQNPSNICYNDSGAFDVTLITTNVNGISDTLTINDYITIYPNPVAPSITQIGNTLTSSSEATYQWYLDGNLIPGATDQSYTIIQSGLYTVQISNGNGCQSQSSINASVTGPGQVPDWNWAHSAGGLSDDEANCVTSDAQGNVYVTGYFDTPSITFGFTTLNNGGATDGFIVKYDASGNVLWAASIASAGADKALSVAADASGNCYVVGYFNSSTITIGATTLTSAGNEDMFIVKYDAVGNVVWAQSAGGAYGDFAFSVTAAADGSGDIYMTGTFPSASITFGSVTVTNTHTGTGDMFIVKYDADGNALWAKNAGGGGNEAAYSVTSDAAGNSYITGQYDSPFTITTDTGITTLSDAGGYDVFLVKYSSDGNVLWAQKGGGSSGDYAYSVAADDSDNSYVTGFFFSPSITFGSITLTTVGGDDMYIVKYDADGNVLWAKNAGGISDVAQSVTIDPSGNVYVTGYFGTPTITFGPITLTNDAFDTTNDIYIVKYDGDGNVIWATSVPGISQDFVNSITADASGNIYLAGYFYSSYLAFDSIILSSTGYFDMFIAKLGDSVPPPISAFLSSATSGCEQLCIDFNDQSSGDPVSWNWTFEGATPSSSSDQNPTNICYSDSGTFDVTLITVNAEGTSDTLTLNDFITVYPIPPFPNITQNGDTLSSSFAASYQWYYNAYLIPGATDQSYTFTQSGLYTVQITDGNGCQSQSSIEAIAVGIDESNDEFSVNILANPSGNQLMIEAAGNSTAELELVNVLGEKLYQHKENLNSSTKTFAIDISGIPSGIYFLVVHCGIQSKTFKVVKG